MSIHCMATTINIGFVDGCGYYQLQLGERQHDSRWSIMTAWSERLMVSAATTVSLKLGFCHHECSGTWHYTFFMRASSYPYFYYFSMFKRYNKILFFLRKTCHVNLHHIPGPVNNILVIPDWLTHAPKYKARMIDR